MSRKNFAIPFFVGYAMVIIAALLYILNWEYAVYLFGAGAFISAIGRLVLLPRTPDKRIRRLNNQQLYCILLQALTVYLMWTNHSAWIIPLILNAFLDIWISYRYPKNN